MKKAKVVLATNEVDKIDDSVIFSPYETMPWTPRMSVVRELGNNVFVRLSNGASCREIFSEDMHCVIEGENFSVTTYHINYSIVGKNKRDLDSKVSVLLIGCAIVNRIESDLGWKKSELMEVESSYKPFPENGKAFVFKLNPRWKRSIHMLYLVTLFVRMFGSVCKRVSNIDKIYKHLLTQIKKIEARCSTKLSYAGNKMESCKNILNDVLFFVNYYDQLMLMLKKFNVMHSGVNTLKQWSCDMDDMRGTEYVAKILKAEIGHGHHPVYINYLKAVE